MLLVVALSAQPAAGQNSLDRARALRDSGELTAAAAVVEAHLRTHPDDAEALFLLATIDYWSGRVKRAREGLGRVLEIDPDHEGAAATLHEIRSAYSPWIRLDPSGGRDTQALVRAGLSGEAGLFITPGLTLDGRASWIRFAWSDSSAHVATGDVGLRATVAGPLALELRAGLANWSGPAITRFTARGAATLRLGAHTSAEFSAERLPYLHTTASIATAVLPTRFQLRVGLDHASGWMGEAAGRSDRFGDGNAVHSVWAWLLAPIVSDEASGFRAGWHVGYQDAGQSRYTSVAGASSDGAGTLPGRYVPYHTPERTFTHGPAGALALWPNGSVALFANASWGLHAAEDAPFFFPADTLPDSPINRGEYRRSFHPLEARATLRLRAGPRTSLFLESTHRRTAFYDDTRFRSGVLVVFLPPPPGSR